MHAQREHIMKRSTPPPWSLVRSVVILALICCSLSCSAAARVALDGSREPTSPPPPVPGGQVSPSPTPVPMPPVHPPPPPPPMPEMSALAPHRKTLQQAVRDAI
ncbi:hypothetical protein VPH35_057195 [Triticum aestivum]